MSFFNKKRLGQKFNSNNTILLIFGLIVLTAFSYFPTLDNDFVQWDDQFYVTNNPLITAPSWENLNLLFTKIISLNYHPITMISLWINSSFSGTDSAFPFIVTNIVIHIINTILVFLLIKKLTQNQWIVAFTTALIFGIHPMHVESVAWISERKDVLYGMFFLLGLISYLNFITKEKHKYLLYTFVLFLLACLSKAMAVSFVPVLYLIDYFSKRNLKGISVHLEKIPFLLMALLIGSIAISVQAGGDFYGLLEKSYDGKALNTSGGVDFFFKMKFACYGLFFYFQKFLFPFDLSAIHPYGGLIELSHLNTLPLFGIALLGGFIYSFFKYPKIAFGLGFFITTIFLVLQFIQVGIAVVAERYTYLPYIGLGFLLGNFLQKKWNGKYKHIIVFTLLLLTGFFSWLTRLQVDKWQNHITLFQNVVDIYPNNAEAREFLATGLMLNGKLDNAIHHLKFAVHNLQYHHSATYELLATCYDEKNEPDTSLYYFDKAIELDSNNFVAYYHRGLLLINHDPSKALEDFIFCKKSTNDYLQQLIHEPIGRCYGMLGNHEMALQEFSKALEFDKTNPDMFYNRGVTYERLGDIPSAIKDYTTALQLDSNMEIAKDRIAFLKQKIE